MVDKIRYILLGIQETRLSPETNGRTEPATECTHRRDSEKRKVSVVDLEWKVGSGLGSGLALCRRWDLDWPAE